MKKVMIIDGLNMFLRSYIVVPSMDKHGAPNGGTKEKRNRQKL